MTRIDFVKRAILKGSRPLPATLGWVFTALAIPTLLRVAMNPIFDARLPYLVYFPAVLLAAVFLGWRPGTIVAIGSAILANVASGVWLATNWSGPQTLLSAALFGLASALMILVAQTLRRSVVELEATIERERNLAAELGHRAKNHLALIEALARQCEKQGESADTFFQRLLPRIQALARAQDLLTRTGWGPCPLAWLVEEALLPFSDHGGITLEGPDVSIPPSHCTPMIIAVHELGTNAAKYGALSQPSGQVAIHWEDPADGSGIRFHWNEHGGPEVAEPQRRGLGTRLLARLPVFADFAHEFPPGGVRCRFRLKPEIA